MRDIDPAPIEAALDAQSRGATFDAEKHKRIETWRARLLAEGPGRSTSCMKWCPARRRADRCSR